MRSDETKGLGLQCCKLWEGTYMGELMEEKGYFRKVCCVSSPQCHLWAKSLELSLVIESKAVTQMGEAESFFSPSPFSFSFFSSLSSPSPSSFFFFFLSFFFLRLLFLSCLQTGIFWSGIFSSPTASSRGLGFLATWQPQTNKQKLRGRL